MPLQPMMGTATLLLLRCETEMGLLSSVAAAVNTGRPQRAFSVSVAGGGSETMRSQRHRLLSSPSMNALPTPVQTHTHTRPPEK